MLEAAAQALWLQTQLLVAAVAGTLLLWPWLLRWWGARATWPLSCACSMPAWAKPGKAAVRLLALATPATLHSHPLRRQQGLWPMLPTPTR